MRPLIQFKGVDKSFGDKVIFRDLNLDVFAGESLTVMGASGVGKSVMLKLLMGLLPTDRGSIFFDGNDILRYTEAEFTQVRRRIGMLFQGAALFDSLSVAENVAYGLREHFHMNETDMQERVAESLEDVGLPGIESMWPADLSGGMKKRVGLARAIALRPEVLLYDEPTTGLDPVNTNRINRLILHLKDKMSVTSVVVTHDMQSAFAVSDRIAMVKNGAIAFSGTVDEVRKEDNSPIADFIAGVDRDDEDFGGSAALQ